MAAYISAQCDVLANNDVGLRTGTPQVHKTGWRCVGCAVRSRSLATSSTPLQRRLNKELVWYAGLLGQVRDCDVLSDRFTRLIADLPADQIRGPIEAEITKALATERDEAMQRLNEAMLTRRYQHFMQLLRGWKNSPAIHRRSRSEGHSGDQVCDKGRSISGQAVTEGRRHRGAASGPEGVQAGAVRR